MQAVEFEQMRRDGGPALGLVDMGDVQTIARPRVVLGPLHRAQRRAQREAADTAHAIDADAHGLVFPAARQGADRPFADLIEPEL